MAVQFFGQFLIDRGEVDAAHIREALALMDETNESLGDLAIRNGILGTAEVLRVHAMQRLRDQTFGDLSVEMGLLSSGALVELVRQQTRARLPIGEALVRLGHLEGDRLPTLLDAFKAEQAVYTAQQVELPDALTNHRATRPLLALLPRFAERVGRMQIKVGALQPLAEPPACDDYRISIPIHGVRGLEVALTSDAAFAERLAIATTGVEAEELDPELVADGVGEFLNVLLGNVVSALACDGHALELGPPDLEATLGDGWLAPLAVGEGRAALVLSLF